METLTTPDGVLHTLIGSTTLESIIRDYAGEDAAGRVRELMERDAYETARAETDLGAFEASLDHWHTMAQDWSDEITDLLGDASAPNREMREFLHSMREQLNNEL